jgi:hypothetical protein
MGHMRRIGRQETTPPTPTTLEVAFEVLDQLVAGSLFVGVNPNLPES